MWTLMKVNFENSTAVFLGPSLPLKIAKSALSANYYPPIKFGDIYKLMASNIETFIIIDGMFGGITPVWHREILNALEAGKKVLGGASMGALRGIELAPYGMQGRGQIYQWYSEGLIDGDDEVALFHGNDELDYQKFSEPLVNIRHNLNRAVDANVIPQDHANQIIQAVKSEYFGNRNFKFIYDFMDSHGINSTSLNNFIGVHYEDLKAKDALELLTDFSNGDLPEYKGLNGWHQRKPQDNHLLTSIELVNGAVYMANGDLVANRDILLKVKQHWHQYSHLMLDAVENYYILQSLGQFDIPNLTIDKDTLLNEWSIENAVDISIGWLSANGYQYNELITEICIEHKIRLILDQSARENQIELSNIENCLRLDFELPEVLRTKNEQELKDKSVKIFFLVKWAEDCGYRVPDAREELFYQRWPVNVESELHIKWLDSRSLTAEHFNKGIQQLLMYIWLIEVEPGYLGFHWEPEVALYRVLRKKGYLRELMV